MGSTTTGTDDDLLHMPPVDFLKVYRLYMAACCFNEVALIFSTMTIMQAVARKSRLHINQMLAVNDLLNLSTIAPLQQPKPQECRPQ
ncbi:hypothetical protein ABZP36_009352 [Zizania latifolia]